jgi:serine O-acetyltransferase
LSTSTLKNEKLIEKKEDMTYYWTPEQMIETILKEEESGEEDWVEDGLPKLVEDIMDNYEEHGGINHIEGKDLPSKQIITEVLEDLLSIIFPGYFGKEVITKSNIRYFLGNKINSTYLLLVKEIEKSLKYVCRRVKKCPEDVCEKRAKIVAKKLLEKIPDIRVLLSGDVKSAFEGDPAAKNIDEVIISYPFVLAIATHRISHELYVRGVPFVPRIMSEYAHSKTGIDIHPGAKIGENFFVDHGTGVVIGETATIGDNVKIYQSVTLGALSFPQDEKGRIIKGMKRHPTVKNDVVIYSGATILGGETIIEDNSIIGGNSWITSSIPESTKVIMVPSKLHYKVKKRIDNI